jgi:CYTH domain-containing protein/CHAD domain-containing protein
MGGAHLRHTGTHGAEPACDTGMDWTDTAASEMNDTLTTRRGLDAREIEALLPTALTRSVEEGSRIVALRWLSQLIAARADWAAVRADPDADPALVEAQSADALHRARVALRRLRATVREHRTLRERGIGRATARHLKALNRATNAVRDRDVQREWLDAEAEALPPAARDEAAQLRARLAREAARQQDRVARAFATHLDPVQARAESRLSTFRVQGHVGQPLVTTTLAAALADRVTRGGDRLFRDLASVRGLDDQSRLHKIRLLLKRQRAMLAPFTGADPALATWYDTATRAQDQLGAMRDAALFAALARDHGCDALAAVLDDTSLSHGTAFLADWTAQPEAVSAALAAAAEALHRIAQGTPVPEPLPLEIERKYLLRGCPPEAEAVAGMRIEQGWLPGERLRERLRRVIAPDGQVRFTRTVKLGPIDARIEVEEETSAELFASLWPLTASARVFKRRHVVPHADLRWEIDVFLDRDLVLAEVELPSTDVEPAMPGWLAPFVERDVTHDPAFLNANLARPVPPVAAG